MREASPVSILSFLLMRNAFATGMGSGARRVGEEGAGFHLEQAGLPVPLSEEELRPDLPYWTLAPDLDDVRVTGELFPPYKRLREVVDLPCIEEHVRILVIG